MKLQPGIVSLPVLGCWGGGRHAIRESRGSSPESSAHYQCVYAPAGNRLQETGCNFILSLARHVRTQLRDTALFRAVCAANASHIVSVYEQAISAILY